MGCGASTQDGNPKVISTKSEKEESVSARDFEGRVPFQQKMNPKSSHINLDLPLEMKKLPVTGNTLTYTASYCYVCQKGFYPTQLDKANQDSYLILENLLDDDSCHLFGVFDGHGETGDLCSYFAANQFGYSLCKELKAYGGTKSLESPGMEKLYTSAFVKTNRLLKQSSVDDSLSGTTAVSILLQGDNLYIGNVGDSRAIIASDVDGSLRYSALSSDQTPFRKDERERLKLKGASIFTMDQINGHEPIHENWGAETGDEIDDAAQDPPRVWDKTLLQPGCAFTRSIGDSVAESVGVFAEPEILTWNLQPCDKFAVVASDGVFEFLPSQTVVDMISQFNDPIEAGQHVVSEAYRLWLQNDERTDDITIVIIYFEDLKAKSGVSITPSTRQMSPRQGANDSGNAKPVRKVASKSKRKDITENWDTSNDVEFDFAANATPKSRAEQERLTGMVKGNFMFAHLTPEQREQLFGVMKFKDVKAGDNVIVEGDAGDEMYFIDQGEFNVLKRDGDGNDNVVFTYTTIGAAFGELSLMYGKPRAASITAKTAGKLWSLGRLAFRAVLMKKNPVGLLRLFKNVPIFRDLAHPSLQQLCEQVQLEEYKDGEVIATKPIGGDFDFNWIMAVVVEGSVSCVPVGAEKLVQDSPAVSSPRDPERPSSAGGGSKGGASVKDRFARDQGMFFGAAELLNSVEHIISTGRCKIAFISLELFEGQAGSGATSVLEDIVTAPKFRGKSVGGKKSKGMLEDPKNVELARNTEFTAREDFVLSMANIQIGNFAILGTFNAKNGKGTTFSAKLLAKSLAADSRMDSRLLMEKEILCAMRKGSPSGWSGACVARLTDYFQNERVIMMRYEDLFMCDLALAIQQNAIEEENKTYYSACLYSAVAALHDVGVMHRFINPGSVYINSKGVPKLADMRYTKLMDGQKSYTICGDPLYFAPEVVKQVGYNYSVDLWSLGCTIYELYEGKHPIGTPEMEETPLYKTISSFEAGTLEFTKKSGKKVRSVVTALLTGDSTARCGYRFPDEMMSKKMFSKVDWANIGNDYEAPWDLISHLDDNQVFIESNLEECRDNQSFKAF